MFVFLVMSVCFLIVRGLQEVVKGIEDDLLNKTVSAAAELLAPRPATLTLSF
jgi:hypothetical protein